MCEPTGESGLRTIPLEESLLPTQSGGAIYRLPWPMPLIDSFR